MTDYELDCEKCHETSKISYNGNISFRNEKRWYEWPKVNCPKCGAINRIARFAKDLDLLFAISVEGFSKNGAKFMT
jgi:RNase P subunit RPR2